ncbi:MAG: MBL fold metallo-hydrolase [Candidatus Kapaibacterium sp.]
MNLGKFKIDAVDTGIFGLDGGSMFGVVPKAIWKKAYDEGDSENRIPLAARLMLIRYDDKIILVDTGNGTKYDKKFQKIFDIDRDNSDINVGLKKFGLQREDITDVILTHLHFDHAGGATMPDSSGKPVPTFPNAKYYVQKDQLEWGKNPTLKDKGSFIKDDFMPLEADGMLETLDGDGDLFPGISMINVHGHTKAMQMVKVSDEGSSILYAADLCPTGTHIRLPFIMGYDNFPLTALEEKKKFWPQAADGNWIIFFEHDAKIQAGRIAYGKKDFELTEKIIISE